jgi:hypothetical protein
MRFRIGGVFAKCPACKADDFYPAMRLTADRRDVYICAGCENQVWYPELLERTRRELKSGVSQPAHIPEPPT